MAQGRIDFQTVLESLLGSENVYFQPTNNLYVAYPCITYKLDDADVSFADNRPYRYDKRYQVTVIDKNPDSDIPDKIALLPKARFDRAYAADNLNHTVFNVFF